MKIKKFKESYEDDKTNQLESEIYNIIDYEIEMEHLPYGDGEMRISDKSKTDAALKIIDLLKSKYNLDLFLTTGKYNL